MAIHFEADFAAVFTYAPVIAHGLAMTVTLTLIGATGGFAIGVLGGWGRAYGNRFIKGLLGAYVAMFRNTPFLVQLFFFFFGLPALGIHLSGFQASCLAIVVNLGAYNTEIIRAGIVATPQGQIEAASSLAMSRVQAFFYVVLVPALKRVRPALASQVVLIMLDSAVCSQIATEELTFAANFIQSRNFRSFETYLVITLVYFVLALVLRRVLLYSASGMRKDSAYV